jgi:uncharacterized protein YggE
MKNHYFAIFIVALFVVAQVAVAEETKREIGVDGTGVLDVEPDIIRISFDLDTINESLDDAIDDNSDKVSDIIDFLKDFGIAEKDIKTSYFSFDTRYHWDKEKSKFDYSRVSHYEVSKSMNIIIRKLDKIEEFVDELANRDITSLNSFKYDVEDRIKHRKKAREMALKAAKEKAQEMVKVMGAKLGKILWIKENNSNFHSSFGLSGANSTGSFGDSHHSDSFASGQISISESVYCRFEIID